MRAKKRKIITAAAKVAAVVVLIGCALILPIGSLTAGAYVYVDNTTSNIIPVGSNTLINDIVVKAAGDSGIALYVGGRAAAGYASNILNTTYYFSQKPNETATRYFCVDILGTLNNITIQARILDYVNPSPGIIWTQTWNIESATTAIRYMVVLNMDTNGTTITTLLNGNAARSGGYLDDSILDNGTTHNVYMSYANSGGVISSALYNGQSKYDWSVGYLSALANASLREAAAKGSYQSGYDTGLALGQAQSAEVSAWTIFENIWTGLDVIMSVEILPNFKLWYLVGLPLATSLILWIVGLFRG